MITGSVRVSSDEQKKKGQQVSAYISSIMKEGVAKENIFLELAQSGSMNEDLDMDFILKDGKAILVFDLKRKRPVLYNWLEKYVREGKIDKHYINKWDRLSRNISLGVWILNYCKKHGTEIVAVNDTNDPKMVFFSLLMAHLESMLTKERVNYNKEFKFEQGLYLGTERLYGYQKTKINVNGREFLNLIPLDSERQMILDVFSDLDYKDVCNRHSISLTTFYNIRKNPFYCGYIEYKGKKKKGIHQPLVSEELWKKYN
ncbi:MAG: recombinase family protein [Anaerolineales bacterium]|jgi:DNA invertase Pin-like site-specific DNA recombinase|nr:recombinase family protein [Anaerolineales bacterium]